MTQNNDITTKTGFQLNPDNINKNGRPPKEFSITNAMRDILIEKDPKTKIERYKKLITIAITKAEDGDNDMIKYIINRLDGMPQGSAPIIPIQVNINPEQERQFSDKYLQWSRLVEASVKKYGDIESAIKNML